MPATSTLIVRFAVAGTVTGQVPVPTPGEGQTCKLVGVQTDTGIELVYLSYGSGDYDYIQLMDMRIGNPMDTPQVNFCPIILRPGTMEISYLIVVNTDAAGAVLFFFEVS
jgi:hypothetical protein